MIMNNPLSDTIRNWCDTHDLGSTAHKLEPSSVRVAQELMRNSHNENSDGMESIKFMGNRFSWPDLLDANSVRAFDCTHLNHIELSDDNKTVKVGGGAKLEHVNQFLTQHGLRLACSPPVIAEQTVAGAIATGTHGQGLYQSSLADTATSFQLINSKGEALRFNEQSPEFGALQMHLGCLGLVSDITLRTCENKVYTCEKVVISYEELRNTYESLNREYEFCKAWWFPWENNAQVWLAKEASPEEIHAFDTSHQTLYEWGNKNTEMNSAVDHSLQYISRDTKTKNFDLPQFKTVLRFKNFENVTGYLDQIFCKGIPVAQINCEIGFPLENYFDVIEELRAWYKNNPSFMHYPVILRSTGPSNAWLSPAFGRETCYFGFVVYQAMDGSFAQDSFDNLEGIQAILSRAGGIPHLGKYFSPLQYDFKKLSHWQDFLDVKQLLDPEGRFTNGFLKQIF